MKARSILFLLPYLLLVPACKSSDMDKATQMFDKIHAQLQSDAQQLMDQFAAKMQGAMKDLVAQGKQAADQKMQEAIVTLMALSPQIQGNVQQTIQGSLAKALTGDPGLLSQVTNMANQNPQLLQGLASQFFQGFQQAALQGGAGSAIQNAIASGIKEAVGGAVSQLVGDAKQDLQKVESQVAGNAGSGKGPRLTHRHHSPTQADAGESGTPGNPKISSDNSSSTATDTGLLQEEDAFFSQNESSSGPPGLVSAGRGWVTAPNNPQVLMRLEQTNPE